MPVLLLFFIWRRAVLVAWLFNQLHRYGCSNELSKVLYEPLTCQLHGLIAILLLLQMFFQNKHYSKEETIENLAVSRSRYDHLK